MLESPESADACPPYPPLVLLGLQSADALETVEFHLSRMGCRCHCVSTVAGIADALARFGPALAVLDIELDDWSVIDVCRANSQLMHTVPVVCYAVDAARGFEQSMQAMRAGALDVLLAPLNVDKLEQLANYVLDCDAVARRGRSDGIEYDGSARPYRKLNGHDRRQTELPPVHVHGAPRKERTQRAARPAEATVELDGQKVESLQALETLLIGTSPAMAAIRRVIAEVAGMRATVMVHGESGTGKELVASAVHRLSDRRDMSFVPVNMATIPAGLAESTLFGHEKGSFTSAVVAQVGWCEAADGGTLFLDEISEMDMSLQPKLLRFLQESTIQRVGSAEQRRVDVRVITATNRDITEMVKSGQMREDLFYRLHVVPIHLPPLRERPEDIEPLAKMFLQRSARRYARNVPELSDEALDLLMRCRWPGNVRQLENTIERMVIFARGQTIEACEIPPEIQISTLFVDVPHHANGSGVNGSHGANGSHGPNGAGGGAANGSVWASGALSPIQRHERIAIIDALQRVEGNVVDAARLLGLGQATVYRKIKQYQIPHERRRRQMPR